MGARDRLRQANAANISTPVENVVPNLVEEIVNTAPEVVDEPIDEMSSTVAAVAETTELDPTITELAETTYIPEPTIDMAATTESVNPSTNFAFTSKKKRTKDKFTTIRLYPELYDQIDAIAKQNDTSFNEILNQVLAQFFNIDIE